MSVGSSSSRTGIPERELKDISRLNMIAYEAMNPGKGVILFNPPNGSYAQHPNALHSFDALYSSDFIPMIVISKEDAQEIIEMLKSSPVEAKMEPRYFEAWYWMELGYIPGRRADEYIPIAAHHDAEIYREPPEGDEGPLSGEAERYS